MDASLQALTKTINKIGEAFEAYKSANDERLEALADGKGSGEAEVKLAKIEKDIGSLTKLRRDVEAEMKAQKDRIEELEARASQPGATVSEKRRGEYKGAFVDWIRSKGQSNEAEQRMRSVAQAAIEAKDITIGTPAAGGFAVPEEISRQIEKLERKFSPVRDLVKVVTTGTSDYKELVSIGTPTSGWVGETASRTATTTPTLRERAPTNGEIYAYPQVSEWSLDDIFFDVEAWLAAEVAESFALNEGDAVIRGNGTNKPTGFLNQAPASTADYASPLRNAAAFQYVPMSPNGASPAVATLAGDDLITCIYTLNSMYRAGASWVMNSNTTAVVRKLKDENGQYHWAPGLQAGQPDRLLGYPTATWEQMDDIGTNAFPIGFGNWGRAYLLADRVGLRVTRDNISAPGFVKFYVRRREGGIVLNNDAVKLIKRALT
jgi:HK97 family phage major capsid protein